MVAEFNTCKCYQSLLSAVYYAYNYVAFPSVLSSFRFQLFCKNIYLCNNYFEEGKTSRKLVVNCVTDLKMILPFL